MNAVWHYFKVGTHPISILTLAVSLFAVAISVINSRRGHFDLMVKKFDLISPVYKKVEIQMKKNELEFKEEINKFKMSFVRVLDSNHSQHEEGKNYLNTNELTNDYFRISNDSRIPDTAQKQIMGINERFEKGMSQLFSAAFDWQIWQMDDEKYQIRIKTWDENSKQLHRQIDQFSFFCRTDLNELTKGIRSRSKLSWFRDLKSIGIRGLKARISRNSL